MIPTPVHRIPALSLLGVMAALALVLPGCRAGERADLPAPQSTPEMEGAPERDGAMSENLRKYATVALSTDLGALSPAERRMIPLLIDAAQSMDSLFWMQAFGDKQDLLSAIADPVVRRYAEINYGPWDRLEDDEPFLEGFGPKPPGARFYPRDMTAEEMEAHLREHPEQEEAFRGLYTMIDRDEQGKLVAIPYHEHFRAELERAAGRLREAAALAEDAGLRRYLLLRADALQSDEYRESDLAWLDMKNNTVDCVIGPIETYEDRLYGAKAAYECFVLVKDREWSRRLTRYAALLPGLQRDLPVPEEYKAESPGTDSDLNAYDVVYYAGDCNAGSKTIAINLPNDEEVQLQKGTRRLQLKNSMRAKFDRILMPIAELLIDEEQRRHVTFDAFFGNTMFHEVAHGLGIKNTITGTGTVRLALKEQASALEEGKADVLGLFMVTRLFESGELTQGSIEDHYVTFLAGIFRSVRFGASSAHGRANMLRFHFFRDHGAFDRDEVRGTYRVNFERMQEAMTELSRIILMAQGDGDHEAVCEMMAKQGAVGPVLQSDLDRLARAGIPVDVVFEQGMEVLNAAADA